MNQDEEMILKLWDEKLWSASKIAKKRFHSPGYVNKVLKKHGRKPT